MSTLPVRFHKALRLLVSLAVLGVVTVAALGLAAWVLDDDAKPPEIVAAPPDRDCADFPTWEEAQVAYEAMPVPYRYDLDGDRDGIACEKLRR